MNPSIPLILALLAGGQTAWATTPDIGRGEAFYRNTHGGETGAAPPATPTTRRPSAAMR